MAERQPKHLKLGVGQIGKYSEINVVLSERLHVLPEAKSFEPLRDVVRHGASLRQAGFAEAVLNGVHVVAIAAIEVAFNRTQRELRVQPQGLR